MTNPESDPRKHERSGRELPALPARAVDLANIIGDAFDEADASGGELTEWGARAIARSLADQYNEPNPVLERFADTGESDLEAISREAMPIYNQPSCSAWMKQQIDYLLTFLLDRARSTPAESKDTSEQTLSPQAIEGINQHGDAFRAFLELPDINQNDPNLLDSFHEFFVGRFASIDHLLDSLTEIALWEREIDALADRHGIPGYISLDMEAIKAHVRDTWDIVSYRGALYAFEK